jgi:hypothetical protein
LEVHHINILMDKINHMGVCSFINEQL